MIVRINIPVIVILTLFYIQCNSTPEAKQSCHKLETPSFPSLDTALHETLLKSINDIKPHTSKPTNHGMVLMESGDFLMGSENGIKDEVPIHKVHVDSFWIDETEVTNAQFFAFVNATEYITTAEKEMKVDNLSFSPGSIVFQENKDLWWKYETKITWDHPNGPDSNIDSLMNHPVVHVSWYDAMAYCRWIGKRLPTEAEWEYAAKKGLISNGVNDINIWQGEFPLNNVASDGYLKSAPVRSFPANSLGLFDMQGNVWEWCSDIYHYNYYKDKNKDKTNPRGPTKSYDPQETNTLKYVMRGGSFLCHESYCSGYRPSARMKSTPESSFEHVGFRCVRDL